MPMLLIILGIVLWLLVNATLGMVLFVIGLVWLGVIASSWHGPGPRRYWY